MASRAELILQAIVSKLTVPAMSSVAAAHVYRDPTREIPENVSAAIVIEAGDEPTPDTSTLGIAYRELEVRISAIARGNPASTAVDAPLVEAHNRLLADQTLSGNALRITEGDTRREREGLEQDVAIVIKTYRIEYRTAETSLEN